MPPPTQRAHDAAPARLTEEGRRGRRFPPVPPLFSVTTLAAARSDGGPFHPPPPAAGGRWSHATCLPVERSTPRDPYGRRGAGGHVRRRDGRLLTAHPPLPLRLPLPPLFLLPLCSLLRLHHSSAILLSPPFLFFGSWLHRGQRKQQPPSFPPPARRRASLSRWATCRRRYGRPSVPAAPAGVGETVRRARTGCCAGVRLRRTSRTTTGGAGSLRRTRRLLKVDARRRLLPPPRGLLAPMRTPLVRVTERTV